MLPTTKKHSRLLLVSLQFCCFCTLYTWQMHFCIPVRKLLKKQFGGQIYHIIQKRKKKLYGPHVWVTPKKSTLTAGLLISCALIGHFIMAVVGGKTKTLVVVGGFRQQPQSVGVTKTHQNPTDDRVLKRRS